jgi:site-specific recombinase XerD
MKRPPPKTKMHPTPLVRAEVLALLGTFSNAPTGLRNRALATLFWRTGLRCNEALSLLLRDLDVDGRTVHVREGKGGVARFVPIDADALATLQIWLVARKRLTGVRSQVLFCTFKGHRLWSTYVRTMLTRHGRRAGIRTRCHAHGLRHTYAKELDRERMPLAQISKLLGHAKSATTSVYIDHVGSQELRDAIDSRPGWASGK